MPSLDEHRYRFVVVEVRVGAMNSVTFHRFDRRLEVNPKLRALSGRELSKCLNFKAPDLRCGIERNARRANIGHI